MRLQFAAANAEDDEAPAPRTILPWANDDSMSSRHANPGIRKHLAARERGYKLRMSKSSDSITAAKLLAESRQQEGGSNLQSNQDMSKSIERQIHVYTTTSEDIKKILDVAKACSVQERVKLFNNQVPFAEPTDYDLRVQKAEAIRREILNAKALGQKQPSEASDTGSGDILMQSPVEVKVKPLKIPMKPKLVGNNNEPSQVAPTPKQQQAPVERTEPGNRLRINQSPNAKSPTEVKSILRTSRSTDRSKKTSVTSQRGSSVENIGSVKSKAMDMDHGSEPLKPKSILVKKSSHESRKKSPKLLHSNSMKEGQGQSMNIYAQSATDISADDEEKSSAAAPLTLPHQQSNGQYLQVPVAQEVSGLKKSKSFATPGQFECALSENEVNAKQRTIMAFFDASMNPDRKTSPQPPIYTQQQQQQQQQQQPVVIPTSVVKRSSAAAIHEKRGSITSISDEILGDDDLKDVDAVFESLLNSTFQEIQSRGREMSTSSANRGMKPRSSSLHHTTSRSQLVVDSSSTNLGNVSSQQQQDSSSAKGGAAAASGGSNTNKRPAVNRKQSKNKLKAGEVRSVISKADMDKEVLVDPVAALPTSHTKKYLPRQQTWANPSPPPPVGGLLQPPQTPSPTQSEYDTCPDPWEDY
jgi:hypothetical protein